MATLICFGFYHDHVNFSSLCRQNTWRGTTVTTTITCCLGGLVTWQCMVCITICNGDDDIFLETSMTTQTCSQRIIYKHAFLFILMAINARSAWSASTRHDKKVIDWDDSNQWW
jgi:hypothetical protein